jgi:hypothetical protein
LEKVNSETYIKTNELKLLDTSNNQIDVSHFFKLTNKPDIENSDNYYCKVRDEEQEFAIVLFDKLTGDLWIYLKYRDVIPANKHVVKSHSYKSF